MRPKLKKVLKYTGVSVGILLLLSAGLGIYINSIIPKPIGKPIILQDLFTKPATSKAFEGKYIYLPATDLARRIRNREISAEAVVKECIANIKANNWKYNALIWLREEDALREARLADEAVAKGDTTGKPLLGVPITIKEMFWVAGSPSTMNAAMYGFIAPRNAVVVNHLQDAGAVILGTTNVPYMLSDYQTQGEVYPAGNNPYDTSRTPGGSTGGGAAALAAGFSALELGSDLGGSIRIPAAFCGLYGLKPTYGVVNITEGVGPDTVTKFTRMALASAGPLARSAEDLELVWEVLKHTKPDVRFQQPVNWKPTPAKTLKEYRIAWMDEWKHGNNVVHVGADVKTKLGALVDSLQGRVGVLKREAPDNYDAMARSFFGSFGAMMSEGQPWLLRKFIGMDFKKWDNGDGNIDALFESLSENGDEHWQQLQTDRKKLIATWEAFFTQYDVFICPITYGPAIKKCPQGSALQGDHALMPYADYFPYANIFNATGHPCIVVPMGLNKDGLPVGIQVVGPYYSESMLIQFARLLAPYTPGFVKPA